MKKLKSERGDYIATYQSKPPFFAKKIEGGMLKCELCFLGKERCEWLQGL